MQGKSSLLDLAKAILAGLAVIFLCSCLTWAGGEQVLYRFPYGPDGANPDSPLILDAAGNLYGTAPFGGIYGSGIVFKLTPNSNGGWTGSILYSFTGGPDGALPQAGLIFDTAGSLYGTTSCGGGTVGNSVACMQGAGTIFKLTPQSNGTWTESVLYSFTGGADGAYPAANIIFDATGNLYGTTRYGGRSTSDCGSEGCGVVFELMPGTGGPWTENVIHTFDFSYDGTDGAYPVAGLVFDQAGNLYGTTSYGPNNSGVVFQLTPGSDGNWTETIALAGAGQFQTGLVIDAAGNLYGVSEGGGTADMGTVFRLSRNGNGSWTETTLHNFHGGSDGGYPAGALIFDPAGNLYGTTVFGGGGKDCQIFSTSGCGTVFELLPNPSGKVTETILHRFSGTADGCCLEAGLVRDQAGNLYGTAALGGTNDAGTVFKLTPNQSGSWTGSLLHTFQVAGHGEYSSANLVSDSSGNLYGTTEAGGIFGFGAVFELTAEGNEVVLYSFTGGLDGYYPAAGLTFDAAGNLYGTTVYGGSPSVYCGSDGCGTVFELSPIPGGAWKETVIHNFSASLFDGNNPYSGVVFDASGNLYGTTENGGSEGAGAVFELTPSQNGAWTETILYSFYTEGGCYAGFPIGGLVIDKAGNLYGTTSTGSGTGGICSNSGTVFKMTPPSNGGRWTLNVLHSFCISGSCADGSGPQANLTLDAAGNIFGTTAGGGANGYGVVFEIPVSGQETTLYTFAGGNDGAFPLSSLAVDREGNIFGTTSQGGGKGQCSQEQGNQFCGTVFELVPGPGGSWTERILHSFSGSDGAKPSAGVLLDPLSGRLYGTTTWGGVVGPNSIGLGVVYELTH